MIQVSKIFFIAKSEIQGHYTYLFSATRLTTTDSQLFEDVVILKKHYLDKYTVPDICGLDYF